MMHLAHPSLTTTGRSQSRKWASADAKRRAQELEQDWAQLNAQWRAMSRPVTPTKKTVVAAPQPYRRGSTQHIPSLPSTHVGAVSSKPSQQYTGDKIVGIGTLHKSNAVPVFSNEEAAEISRMRRG